MDFAKSEHTTLLLQLCRAYRNPDSVPTYERQRLEGFFWGPWVPDAELVELDPTEQAKAHAWRLLLDLAEGHEPQAVQRTWEGGMVLAWMAKPFHVEINCDNSGSVTLHHRWRGDHNTYVELDMADDGPQKMQEILSFYMPLSS